MKKCNSDSHGQETSSRYLFAADEQSTNQWSEEKARKAGKRKLWYQYLAKENPNEPWVPEMLLYTIQEVP